MTEKGPGGKKRVSVILPFHDRRAPFLRAAALSCLDDLDPVRDELIVIDDGSNDDSGRCLSDLDVRLIRLPRSLGPAAARNAGLRAAQGELITFFDSDDLLVKGAIRRRREFLDQHPHELAVGGKIERLIDDDGRDIGPYDSIHFYSVKRPPYRLSRQLLRENRDLPVHLWLVLFRREIFERVGLLNEWLRCGEDLDFFCRFLELYSVPFIDCEVASYRVHADNLSLTSVGGTFKSTPTAVASQFLISRKHGLIVNDSPFAARTDFRFGNVVVSLTHPNERLGQAIEAEFAGWKVAIDDPSSPEITRATFEILAGKEPSRPDPGAIRTRFWQEMKSYEYRLETTNFDFFQENYFARKDYAALRATVSYSRWEPYVEQFGCSAFKWLVIKAMEKRGYGYIHGSCLLFHDKCLIFSGDPGSGKSSCAERLVRQGARLVTDDAVLFKQRTIFPFDHTPSVRGDFRDRFGIRPGEPLLSRDHCQTSPVSQTVAAVVFPCVWEDGESVCEPLLRDEGLRRLSASYLRETGWNAYPEPERRVREQFESLLSDSLFFEFRAGRDEEEVRRALGSLCRKLVGLSS